MDRYQYLLLMAGCLVITLPLGSTLLTVLALVAVGADGRQTTGLRAPWDIPVEDVGSGFAMVTLTILLGCHRLDREQPQHPGAEHQHAGPDQGLRQRAAGLPDPEGATPAA